MDCYVQDSLAHTKVLTHSSRLSVSFVEGSTCEQHLPPQHCSRPRTGIKPGNMNSVGQCSNNQTTEDGTQGNQLSVQGSKCNLMVLEITVNCLKVFLGCLKTKEVRCALRSTSLCHPAARIIEFKLRLARVECRKHFIVYLLFFCFPNST